MKAVTARGTEIECADVEEASHGLVLYDNAERRVGYVPYATLSHVAARRTPVSSSNLRSVGYDRDDDVLEIEFHSGGVYEYYDVPQSVYEGLLSAASHGSYFHREIRGQYDYRRIL